jgi:hypothetical protein
VAGPWVTLPSEVNREPWQGQSQVFSALFQATMQPICGQTAELTTNVPPSARCTASWRPFLVITLPSPGSGSSLSLNRFANRSPANPCTAVLVWASRRLFGLSERRSCPRRQNRSPHKCSFCRVNTGQSGALGRQLYDHGPTNGTE